MLVKYNETSERLNIWLPTSRETPSSPSSSSAREAEWRCWCTIKTAPWQPAWRPFHLKKSGIGSASSHNTIFQILISLRLWIRWSFAPSVRDNLSIVLMMEWAVMEVSPLPRALPSLAMLYLTALRFVFPQMYDEEALCNFGAKSLSEDKMQK